MLEINSIKNNLGDYSKSLKKRGLDNIDKELNQVIGLDDERKSLKSKVDIILTESNKISKEIGQYINSGDLKKVETLKKESSELKGKSKRILKNLKTIESKIKEILVNIPNVPDDDVPSGNSDEDNAIIFSSEIASFEKRKSKPHWDIIKEFNLIDFETGNNITGAGFPIYVDKGAKLQRALISYFIDEASKDGYKEIQPPILVNEKSAFGTGQLPDKDGQMYKIEDENLYLIPTAEVPITNIYDRKILDTSSLPIKNVAYTPCFRREAGSWGSHVRGLNRLHQFDKVEIVQIQEENRSRKALDNMCDYVEKLIKSLGLSYRKLLLCAGDLGFSSSITYDFEVYAPGQKKWLECSSVSNFKSYQANRMNLKIRNGNKKVLANTLNGSALALPRILAAILETNHSGNEIVIPEILHNYTGFEKITL